MRAFNNKMLFGVDKRLFTSRITAPKNKDNVFLLVGNEFNDAVGEPRPTAFGMGIRLVCPNGQGRVEQKYPFVRPFC